jgi:hypothetical protein
LLADAVAELLDVQVEARLAFQLSVHGAVPRSTRGENASTSLGKNLENCYSKFADTHVCEVRRSSDSIGGTTAQRSQLCNRLNGRHAQLLAYLRERISTLEHELQT